MQNIFDVDTVGYNGLGGYYDIHQNNAFYLLAPEYYRNFYTVYLKKALQTFDGYDPNWHRPNIGLVPERIVMSVARGLNNMLFAHGIDFVGDQVDYDFITQWANKVNLYSELKKAHFFVEAGGTALLSLDREHKDLYISVHRIDTYFVDVGSNGEILNSKIYFDLISNTNYKLNEEEHYGICEERYYNEKGQASYKCSVYKCSGTLVNETTARPYNVGDNAIEFSALPVKVKSYIKKNYPSILLGKEELLPFGHSLGVYMVKFTETNPITPLLPFGQPIGDILRTESYQYDQMKYFEKNEVDLARARALIPEEMWNLDDPDFDNNAFDQRFFQKVKSLNGDDDKITRVQFDLRGNDIRTQIENIYRDISAKLNVSASTIASFLSEGSGARTATEITNERTKSDTWNSNQIRLLSPAINQMLRDVMLFYNKKPVSIVFKCEDQTPLLETVKTFTDMFSQGAISPQLFVKTVHKHLTEQEQQREIDFLLEQAELRKAQVNAYAQQSNIEPTNSNGD